MAVQAQLYPENLGLPLPMCGLHDCLLNPVSGTSFEANFCFSLLQDPPLHHQQLPPFQLQQQQQQSPQYLANIACNRGASSSASSTCNNLFSMAVFRSLDVQLEMQRQEIDCILQE